MCTKINHYAVTERPHPKQFLPEQNSISKDLLEDLQKIVLSLQQTSTGETLREGHESELRIFSVSSTEGSMDKQCRDIKERSSSILT
jgi:hypothetical protein